MKRWFIRLVAWFMKPFVIEINRQINKEKEDRQEYVRMKADQARYLGYR